MTKLGNDRNYVLTDRVMQILVVFIACGLTYLITVFNEIKTDSKLIRNEITEIKNEVSILKTESKTMQDIPLKVIEIEGRLIKIEMERQP